MSQIKLSTIREEVLIPNYSDWDRLNSKWEAIGVKWEDTNPIFPDGFVIEQWDDGHGGSTTYWAISNSDGQELVGIKRAENHQGPWGMVKRIYPYKFYLKNFISLGL